MDSTLDVGAADVRPGSNSLALIRLCVRFISGVLREKGLRTHPFALVQAILARN